MTRPVRLSFLGLLAILAGCVAHQMAGDGRSGAGRQLPDLQPGPVAERPWDLPRAQGPLLLNGGGRSDDRLERRLAALAGPDPRLCVIDTAANERGASVGGFARLDGVTLTALDIGAEDADDPSVAAALQGCAGYFFGGGDPRRLARVLLPAPGAPSLALRVIAERHLTAGAPVAGSSAGAMVAGGQTLCTCGAEASQEALESGRQDIEAGFDFLPGTLVDAHFLARGLVGRHLLALEATGLETGIGLDEETWIEADATGWRVEGRRGVALFRRLPDGAGWRFHLLRPGDRIDPVSFEVTPAFELLPVPPGDPSLPPRRLPHALSNGALEQAAAMMVASPAATGEMGLPGAARLELRRTAETRQWGRHSQVSVSDLELRLIR